MLVMRLSYFVLLNFLPNLTSWFISSCKRVIITASFHSLAIAYFVDIVVNNYGNGELRKG